MSRIGIRIVVLIVTGMLVTTCFAQQEKLSEAKSALGGGLVGWWKLDEGKGVTAKDSSGQGNDGEVVDTEWTKGKSGSALLFDGQGSYVDCMDKKSLNAGKELTVEAWVKPAQNQKWGTILAKENYTGNKGYLLHQNVNVFMFRVYDGSKPYTATTPVMVETDNWYCVAGVFDGEEVKIYVNGKLEKSAPAAITVATAEEPFFIGHRSTVNAQLFNGVIDEVKVYNRALTDKEIEEHFKLGSK